MTKTFEALASGDTLEMRIYGPIGSGMFSDGISAESVSRALDAADGCKHIVLRMSSPGGSAFDGMAIRAMLSAHPATVTCEVEGLAASAASIIAMGADRIKMHEGSAMMIHQASTMTGGDVAEHEKAIAALSALNDGMASVYAKRSGMGKDDCVHLMQAETWMTPQQACDKGFADEVISGKAPASAPKAFDLKPYNYRHAPAQFDAAARQLEIPGSIATAVTADTGVPAAAIASAVASALEANQPPTAASTTQPVPPQVAVATTAEPPTASRKRSRMTINLIAQAVGLQADAEESAVVAAVSRMNAMVAELRSVAGADSAEALLGAVRGLVETAKQVPTLQAKIAEQDKAIEAQKRAAIFSADAVDPKGRKLTPAMHAFWAERSVAELEAFLAVAPHIVVTTPAEKTAQQPAVSLSDPHASAIAEPVKHNGKAWEDMKPAEKAALHAANPEIYAALRQSFVERGSPRAQGQQQRASA